MTSAVRLSDQALCDIQGIITSGYGHLPYAAYLFVSMTNAAGARRWLSAIASSITASQHRIVGHRLPEDRPPVAVNIGLTAEGLRAIDLPAEVITTFPVEFQDGISSEERSRILGDTGASAPQTWEVGGPLTDPVHAMLMLFAADEAALDDLCRVHRGRLEASGGAVELPGSVQRGYRPDTFTEPFGFHDGIAQPSIVGLTGHGVPTGEFILGYENHYGLIPPTPVVPAQMNRARTLPQLDSPYHAGKQLGDLGRNGSYLVYRKLQQDVAVLAVHGSRVRSPRQRGSCAHGVAGIEVRGTLALRRTAHAGSRWRRPPSRRQRRFLLRGRSRRTSMPVRIAHSAHEPA